MRFPFISRQVRLSKAPRRNRLSRKIGRGFEQLEDRRLLATIPVTLASDASDPVDDGAITLREAITYVNEGIAPPNDLASINGNLGTNDTIIFALPAGKNTITLGIDAAGNSLGLASTGELSITGEP